MESTSPVSNRWVRPAASLLVWVEAVALVVAAVAYAVHGVMGSDDTQLSWALAIMIGVLAVPLVAAARALGKGRRWGRSYGLMWQVLQVAAGWYLLGEWPMLGVAVMAVALAAAVAIVLDTRADPQI